MLFIDTNGKFVEIKRQDYTSDKDYYLKIMQVKTKKKIINNEQKKNIISTILYEDK